MSKDLNKIYDRLLEIYKQNRVSFKKAQQLESELEDAVWNDDSDAEYDVLESRSDAWDDFNKRTSKVAQMLGQLNKAEATALNQIAFKALEQACNVNSRDLDLIDALQAKVLERSWNAPDVVPSNESVPTP